MRHHIDFDSTDGDFNFWPSFTDLMLSLVLVLIVVMILVRMFIATGTVNLSEVQKHQEEMIQAIASAYNVTPRQQGKDEYAIQVPAGDGQQSEITIKNELNVQRLSFKDRILFPSDEFKLSESGQSTLKTVGLLIRNQLPRIREIQIQGHADPDRTYRYDSNLHLAALRAIEVFGFFQNTIGIDPSAHLMSATSFGEFKPVERTDPDATYSYQQLAAANMTTTGKSKNRRIEIFLFYKR